MNGGRWGVLDGFIIVGNRGNERIVEWILPVFLFDVFRGMKTRFRNRNPVPMFGGIRYFRSLLGCTHFNTSFFHIYTVGYHDVHRRIGYPCGIAPTGALAWVCMTELPTGVLCIDKPPGITSYDVIRRIKRARGDASLKVGHAGTLDPLASGLMILAEGPATKLLSQFLKLPKVYEAEICIGESTTTGDRGGDVTARVRVVGCGEEDVRKTLVGMVGILELPVPAFSAIKRGGEALYKKARRGEVVETPVKPMEVRGAECVKMEEHDGCMFLHVRFDVGSGTYIRSLAEELGRRLGYPARLENLRRTQVGEWRVEDAIPLP